MAVTADQYTKFRNAGMLGDTPVAASTTLYDLSLCFISATGYLDDDTASGVNKFAGVVASGQADNSSGSAGDISGEHYQSGEFLLTGSGFAQADVGKRVYASDNYTITESAEGTVYIGRIVKYVSATQVWVCIDVHVPEMVTVADPGDAGSIGATANSFYCELVTAGAETRTLADPVAPGLTAIIAMRTDGGNAVVTAATAINATGNNTLTFADEGDTIVLVSAADTGAADYKWVDVTTAGGVALTTV